MHGIKAPSSNIQAPEKHQASSTKPPATRLCWDLVLGYSLEVGAWCFGLAIPPKTARFFAVFSGMQGIEAPEKHQGSSSNPLATRLSWDLVLGCSLDVGAWCLVLRSGNSTENSEEPTAM